MNWLFGKKATEGGKEPWQVAIDEEEKRKKEAEKAEWLLGQKKLQEEYQRNVQKLGEKFKCHCCGKPATRPGRETYEEDKESTCMVDDWRRPGDLYPCLHCGQFTCKSCLYKGICKTCALEMLSKH